MRKWGVLDGSIFMNRGVWGFDNWVGQLPREPNASQLKNASEIILGILVPCGVLK